MVPGASYLFADFLLVRAHADRLDSSRAYTGHAGADHQGRPVAGAPLWHQGRSRGLCVVSPFASPSSRTR